MAEYIERDAALNANFKIPAKRLDSRIKTARDAVQAYANYIADLPAADVQPVVRGKWLLVNDEFIDEVKCSNCGVVEYFEKGWKYYNFCPNCGADMRR